jgi:hypothetical protein
LKYIFSTNTKTKILKFSLLAALVFMLFPFTGKALTVSPPQVEMTLVPGQKAEMVIKLYNEEETDLTLYTDSALFTSNNVDGLPVYDFNASKEDISTWFEVEKGPITLKSKERKSIPVTINTPTNAGPGGHYAVLAFSKNPPKSDSGTTQISIASQIGVLILARIEGEIQEAGQISSFISDAKQYRYLPVNFRTIFNNTGNVHLRPTGKIIINNTFGKKTAELNFNEANSAVLPDSSRTYDSVWQKAQNVSENGNIWSKFWQAYKNEKNNFGLGKYTANLQIQAGTNKPFTTAASATFWVLPWHMLLVWLIVLVIVVILLIVLIKRYNRWVIRKAQERGKNPPADKK